MPRPRLHDDALRLRLLEVTSEVISTAGPGAVTMRDVARRAGTSASAVYTLLGGKDALIAAVVDEGFRRFGDHLAAVDRTDDAARDLLELGLAYRHSALADPHFYRVMFDRAATPATDRSTFAVLRDAVGRVLGDDRDGRVARVAIGLWALVHGLVSLELAGLLPGDAEEHAARYEDQLRAAGAVALGAGPR